MAATVSLGTGPRRFGTHVPRSGRFGQSRPPRSCLTAAVQAAAQPVRTPGLRPDAPPAGGNRPPLAGGERRVHADGEDHLPQPRRRSRRPGVRVPAADDRGPAAIRRWSGCTRTSADICTSTTFRMSARLVARGYVVIAPEYRGSIGYGPAFYDAIDYGGAEVDDVVTAVDVLASTIPAGRSRRASAIIGWSHGGMIALLSVFRNPSCSSAAAALVPVTNLFHRLASKGVERQRQLIDPQNRFGGPPSEKREVYRDRSPLFHVDKLTVPLLVHIADNDEDVTIEEGHAARRRAAARKPSLATPRSTPPARRPQLRSPGRSADVGACQHARSARLLDARLGISGAEPSNALTGGILDAHERSSPAASLRMGRGRGHLRDPARRRRRPRDAWRADGAARNRVRVESHGDLVRGRRQHRAVRLDRAVRRGGDEPLRRAAGAARRARHHDRGRRRDHAHAVGVASRAAVGRPRRRRHRRHVDDPGRNHRHTLVRRASRPGARRPFGGQRDRPAGLPAAAGIARRAARVANRRPRGRRGGGAGLPDRHGADARPARRPWA